MAHRILHVLDHSLPLHSGYTFRTLAILAAQRARGWETHHITGAKQGKVPALEETVDGWAFHRTPFRAAASGTPVLNELVLLRDLHARLERSGARLAARHHPRALPGAERAAGACWSAGATAFRSSTRCGRSGRTRRSSLGQSSQGGLRYRATRGLETLALRRADAVTTICEGLRGDIVARGIASDKVTVIPNAVDLNGILGAEAARSGADRAPRARRQGGDRLLRLVLPLRRPAPAARGDAGPRRRGARPPGPARGRRTRRTRRCAAAPPNSARRHGHLRRPRAACGDHAGTTTSST